MSRAAPAVALLFDDVELGRQLRDALSERGARIVHEGDMSTLTRELLDSVGAQVLVVNLDDSADDALDRLYEVIEGDNPRVVFNDAQASRELTGWDRARWARHLAVKVLETGDLDPPRPEHARGVEVVNSDLLEAAIARESAAEFASPPSSGSDSEMEAAVTAAASESSTTMADLPSFAPDEGAPLHPEEPHARAMSEASEDLGSEDLAAELEALLASGDLTFEEEATTGSGLRFTGDEELPPLHDGNFGPPADDRAMDVSEPVQDARAVAAVEKDAGPGSVTPPVYQLDHLTLEPLTDGSTVQSGAGAEPVPADAPVVPAHAPEGWALLGEDDVPAASAHSEKAEAADFGVHKVSAIDFLAPDADQAGSDDEVVMSLQLLSMEEAIAPKVYEDAEAVRANSLGQIVLLGAAAASGESVRGFLAALPPTTKLAFVHTQHLGEASVDTLVQTLAAHCALPVRVARPGSRVRAGEILVVPAGRQLLLIRDGSVELVPGGASGLSGPSIDATFSMAANVFGRDTLAIVFAGTDALAGARAVHDRGGRVWIESPARGHAADGVSDISAERLASFSGTPHELAAHLIEVFP